MEKMAQENLDEFFLDEDEGVFDPLAEDFEPAQDGADPDEDGIVDLPVMAEMPEEVKVKSVFDKDRFANAQDAIEELLHRNPGRKPVFLQIIEFCLTVRAAHREGSALEELLASDTESVYLPVYERVLAFCAQEPRTKPQIDAIVDDDPLVQKPRRYSNHFIELLENREALSWHDGGWNATELGRRYLEKHGIAAE